MIKYIPIILSAGLIFSACDSEYDSGEGESCERTATIQGVINGVGLGDLVNTSIQSTWYIRSPNNFLIQEDDLERIKQLGLDPDNTDDRSRYAYLVMGYQHGVMFLEDNYSVFSNNPILLVKKDLSTYFFELDAFSVQPNEAIDVVDFSVLQTLRAQPVKYQITLRSLIDEMRFNGKADAVMGFVADREDESPLTGLLVNLFSPNTLYASGGQVKFYSARDTDGDALFSFNYPVTGIETLSFKAQADFNSDEVRVDLKCAKIKESDDRFIF